VGRLRVLLADRLGADWHRAPRGSGPADLRAAGDRLDAVVVEADQRLVAAVVVGRPEQQRRVTAVLVAGADRAALVAGLVEAAPEADERVVLPLRDHGRRLAVAGVEPDV